jgi:chemotaxis protein methyltransferase WspC
MAADFANLLKAAIGLDAASIGTTAIDRAVAERQAACRSATRDAYWQIVRGSDEELQALIEAVVVPETWFCRDPEAFAAMSAHLVRTARALPPSHVLQALSLPCATGEEPYSMAMALLDANLPPRGFHVDGIDISQRSLTHAQAAIYRKVSFRGTSSDFRRRHFERVGDRHRVSESVRRQVAFRHGNLLRPDTLPRVRRYDVVFCRNVLIYFDRAAREQAVSVLRGLLAPGGLLFVGPAETSALVSLGFVPAGLPNAHALRVADPVAAGAEAPARPRRPAAARGGVAGASTARPLPIAAPPASARAERASAPAISDPKPPDLLQLAAQLADEGRFADAARHCETHLQRRGPSAQAFYLLGLVSDAEGKPAQAAVFYRKALYLDPHHHDALLQMAVVMDAERKPAEAARFRSRAQRAAEREHAS